MTAEPIEFGDADDDDAYAEGDPELTDDPELVDGLDEIAERFLSVESTGHAIETLHALYGDDVVVI